MTFIDNHDKNSWEGTPASNFGDGLRTAMVLAATINGMPLVYSGQEAGLDRSLLFFEKDSILWEDHSHYDLYKKLFELKHENQALWNGEWGGEMVRITNDQMDKVISFVREKNGDKVISITNFSDEKVMVQLDSKFDAGSYSELFTGREYIFHGADELTLEPWSYLVLSQKRMEE
jgi:glycosidase